MASGFNIPFAASPSSQSTLRNAILDEERTSFQHCLEYGWKSESSPLLCREKIIGVTFVHHGVQFDYIKKIIEYFVTADDQSFHVQTRATVIGDESNENK